MTDHWYCCSGDRRRRQRPSYRHLRWRKTLLILLCCFIATSTAASTATADDGSSQQRRKQHDNFYAVIVNTSRYWFNYRHAMNAWLIYDLLVNQFYYPPENIVTMMAGSDESGAYASTARNPIKNCMPLSTSNNKNHKPCIYGDEVSIPARVDYRGTDVTVDHLVHALTGSADDPLPVLESDSDSHVVIYLTGHGGNQFLKFQDDDELLARDLARIVERMSEQGKFQHLLMIADTCQAFTLFDDIVDMNIPNVTMIGSSLIDESSYAHHADVDVGLSVVERYTYELYKSLPLRTKNRKNTHTLQSALVNPFSFEQLKAHVGIASTEGQQSPEASSTTSSTIVATLEQAWAYVEKGIESFEKALGGGSKTSGKKKMTKTNSLPLTEFFDPTPPRRHNDDNDDPLSRYRIRTIHATDS